MAATSTKLMTFAEFEQRTRPSGVRHELRHGELVQVAPLKNRHFLIQQVLRDLLDGAAAGDGRAYTEVGFRALPEYEYRTADVAYLSAEELARHRAQDYLMGAPDLVIEVLSPSNTAQEMLDKEQVCLENGSREFWVVDAGRRQVRVSTSDGRVVTYKAGQQIPLVFAPGKHLSVNAIFE